MTNAEVVKLAWKHRHADVAMESSAVLCAIDAESLMERGFDDLARGRAMKSLRYSVGILSPVYAQAMGLSEVEQYAINQRWMRAEIDTPTRDAGQWS